MLRVVAIMVWALLAPVAQAGGLTASFPSIDGGTLNLEDWRGRPVLVVNTASKCGFTDQYADLQALYDRFRDRGLVVLAVPSDDFNQELDSAAEVQAFCEINYDLNMPMTDILPVRGAGAHPFFRAVQDETGFEPRWNFHKILIDGEGRVAGTWGSGTRPLSGAIVSQVEPLLN